MKQEIYVKHVVKAAQANFQIVFATMEQVCRFKKKTMFKFDLKIKIKFSSIEYSTFGNYCPQCPFGSTGEFPNCKCSNGQFDGYFCLSCPWNSYGSYGNCTCEDDSIYDEEKNACLKCPSLSTGTYPSCICDEPFKYIEEKNLCSKCPENSSGTYPNCECDNGLFAILQENCVQCPNNSTGLYKN